jgi:hypothetical protein
MSAARWVCPRCGQGRLAPRRPRRDDVRRYCLRCSEQTGRLVERVAPALEHQREQRQQAAAERRKRKAERERERERAYYTVAGVDLREEMRRLVRLRAFGGRTGRLARRPPTLHVRRASSYPSVLGRAWWHQNRIQLTDYPGITREDVLETLCHELVHIHERTDEDGRAHGYAFRAKMAEAFEEAYGVRPRGGQRRTAYHGRYAAALRGA